MDLATVGLVFLVVLVIDRRRRAAMAIGRRSSGRCLRGSCGGPGVVGPDGERLSCRDCPNRKDPAGSQPRPTGSDP